MAFKLFNIKKTLRNYEGRIINYVLLTNIKIFVVLLCMPSPLLVCDTFIIIVCDMIKK